MRAKRTLVARRGAALVMFAGGLVALLGMLAMVVDVGFVYAMRSRYQAVIDVAAISALRSIDPSRPLDPQVAVARAIARATLRANGLTARNYTVAIHAGGNPGDEVSLAIEGWEEIEAFFARVFGRGSWGLRITNRALGLKGKGGGLDPVLSR